VMPRLAEESSTNGEEVGVGGLEKLAVRIFVARRRPDFFQVRGDRPPS